MGVVIHRGNYKHFTSKKGVYLKINFFNKDTFTVSLKYFKFI